MKQYQSLEYSCGPDGVAILRMHTRGGPALWSFRDGLHLELGEAFAEIAADPAVRVLILTGTGDSFCAGFDMVDGPPKPMTPAAWNEAVRQGKALIMNLLAIPVPVIGVVNGPAWIHAELPLLSDIVLAAEHASFRDMPHFPSGVVPGDGVQVLWPMLLGPNRGRYFLLTGETIDAEEGLRLGVVGEVLPAAQLMDRALALAESMASRSPTLLRHTRLALTANLKARFEAELEHGLLLEGMAVLDR